MLKNPFVLFLLFMLPLGLKAQNEDFELAETYFKLGEFEKAKSQYQKLLKTKNNQIHDHYLTTLIRLKEYAEAEKYLKKELKAFPENVNYKLQNYALLQQQKKTEEATKYFETLIKETTANEAATEQVLKYLLDNNETDQVVSIILKARDSQTNPTKYSQILTRAYFLLGQKEKAFDEVLSFGFFEQNHDYTKGSLQDLSKDDKDKPLLEKFLYKKVQDNPNEIFFADILIWNLIQKKDFNKAFFQARALDRRLRTNGDKVFEIAGLAFMNKEYKDAATMYEFICKERQQSDLYPYAKRLLINCREEIVKNAYPVQKTDIRALIADYQSMFNELGQNHKTMEALRNTSKLYAFYLNQIDTAKAVLDLAIKIAANDRSFVDKCKLDMGDLYLLNEEPWEATLLYSQVEKSQKEEQLGHDAKLKNARLSYYTGNFDLAKETLDVLKQATTREISNDAMALSLLIQDNTGLDTTTTAMKDFAAVDLLIFQQKYDEALKVLEKLSVQYSSHSLADDILLLRANIHLKINQPEKALEDYQTLLKNYQYEVTADDAIFNIAKLYDDRFKQKDKAMEYYQKILVDFPGSIYGAESRKRYRQLRGDVF